MKIIKLIPASLILLSLVLVFSLAGCNNESNPTDVTSSTPSATPAVVQQIPNATTPSSQVMTSPVNGTPSATAAPATRTITDMYGRSVTIPSTINRVLTTGPIEMQLVYLIAPDKLAGLPYTFNGKPALVPEKFASLPVIGGWFGTQTGNYETFIASNPDIILEGTEATLPERQTKFGGIPVVGVKASSQNTNYANDTLTGYEEEIRFLGELLNAQDKAADLITYYKDAMNYVTGIVSQIPEAERVKVYYAEGKEGFNTDPAGSMHTQLIQFCGGINVAQVEIKQGYGMADASLEQILLWNPDMIIIGRGSQSTLYKTIMTDSRWSQLEAIRNRQVTIRPENPMSWFDGPPGPSQIVGMYWMVNKLYPSRTADLDLNSKIKEFYSKFFHYDLTDAELTTLLANPE